MKKLPESAVTPGSQSGMEVNYCSDVERSREKG